MMSQDIENIEKTRPDALVASTSAVAYGSSATAQFTDAVQQACSRIAPCWPLDRLIAVNPWWGFIDQPVQQATLAIERLSPTHCTMPISWFQERYAAGEITQAALAQVLLERDARMDTQTFLRLQASAQAAPNEASPHASWLITDALDAGLAPGHEPSWRGVVRHAIGQHCAMWFDRGQAQWQPPASRSMYESWRALASHDDAPSLLTGQHGISSFIAALPATRKELLEAACAYLRVSPEDRETYFTALLLDVSGWAGWCAYLRFGARQQGADDTSIEDLLAIRLAWEWVLFQTSGDAGLAARWSQSRERSKRTPAPSGTSDRWIWQEALEVSWQETVHQGLASGPSLGAEKPAGGGSGGVIGTAETPPRPVMQAAFCIDVRSEPMRRALELCDPQIRTHGFAGFFGLPIEFQSLASSQAVPQLPGPLAAKLKVVQRGATPEATEKLGMQRRGRLGRIQAWQGFRTAASGGFGYVETLGLGYAWKLLQSSIGRRGKGADVEMAGLTGAEVSGLHPVFDALTADDAVNLAAGVLGAMSLRGNFAPFVLLVGHGSESANNPHAHGLDCGACCGQSGQINARTLAALLNDPAVRAGLAKRGLHLPEDTRFIGGLHNTTTDEIRLFDTAAMERDQPEQMQQLRRWLNQAGERTRQERAPLLGVDLNEKTSAPSLLSRLRYRAADWAQVRPEWGLTNNAGFIAAPRECTRHMNLAGRVFLHDYDHAADTDHSVLTLILTAPVVVAHWISMQYYASTVDNVKWGSGNKVLHNVVGGDIGVFEGNGGDLRIGLPMQSLHDGTRWMHTPLRLSVWIEAAPAAIAKVVAANETVRQLVQGEWLHLFCIAPETGQVLRYRAPVPKAASEPFWTEVSASSALV
jgi:uncharacterized protein YbcC (UPF0753/DUF2309 family)